MDYHREHLRQLLKDYYTTYYAELRRQLPMYTTAPEQIPPFLRSHARIITIAECADGYVVTHRTNPVTVGEVAETFVMLADDWDRTVRDAPGTAYAPYSDFAESELRLAHNVLLLERGNLLVRLEGAFGRERALELARSLE